MAQEPNKGSFISAALILGASYFASRLVGLVRERVFTTTFGAGDTFDAFVAAFRIPDLVFNLVVVGVLSAAFIPLFTEKLVGGAEGKKRAFDFSLAVLNTIVLGVVVLMAIFVVFAHQIVPAITPGFGGEKLELTIRLSRIMALQPILLAISSVFSGVLNSFKRFVAYAVAPILYNVGIIFGVLVLVPSFGLAGIAWGVVVGAAAHMLVQLPSILAVGWRWRPRLHWSSGDAKVVWKMLLPRVFGLGAQQINLLVVTVIGSTLLAGSISAYQLANDVQALPVGIFGLAFAQAAFPTLAEQAAKRQHKTFLATLTITFRYILFFVIPLSIFFFLLRAQIVRVLFGSGAFDWEDTILTFETLGWLTLSIFAQATVPLLTRAFYVRQDTLTPVLVSLASITVNIGLAVWLAPILGVQGLALAFSVSAVVNLLLLAVMVRRKVGKFSGQGLAWGIVKMTLAALGAGAAVQLLKYPVAALVDMQRFWGVFTQLTVAILGGGGMYLLLCWLFDCEELAAVRRYIPKRFQPVAVGEAEGGVE